MAGQVTGKQAETTTKWHEDHLTWLPPPGGPRSSRRGRDGNPGTWSGFMTVPGLPRSFPVSPCRSTREVTALGIWSIGLDGRRGSFYALSWADQVIAILGSTDPCHGRVMIRCICSRMRLDDTDP